MKILFKMSQTGRRALLLAGSLVLSSTFGAAAQANDSIAPAISTVTETSHYKSAYRLADLQQGGPKLSPQLIQNLRSQMAAAFGNDANISFLENEYPGVVDAILDDMLPIIVRQTEDTMPVFFDRLARLYMANLTEAEIQDMIGFMELPAYDRLRTSMENSMDVSGLLAGDLEADITAEDLNKVVTDSAAKAVPGLTTKDQMSIVMMSMHPSFKKFAALKDQRVKIEADWSNESTPEEDAELDEASTKAIEQFTGLDFSDIE